MPRARNAPIRDLIFICLVVGFFGLAVLFVLGCELVIGRRGVLDEGRER